MNAELSTEILKLAGGVVGTVGLVLVGWWQYGRRKQASEEKDGAQDTLSARGQGGANISVNVPVNVSVNALAGNVSTRGHVSEIVPAPTRPMEVASFTHGEIVGAINAALPFHRTEVEKSFIGRRVRWRAKLRSVDHYGEKAHVFGELVGERANVGCHTTSEGSADLSTLPEGAVIEVEGEIEKISTHYAMLTNGNVRRAEK
ncbi:MAG: hypothetical protein WCS65_09555 [Verrucomicrobiae bacterium]